MDLGLFFVLKSVGNPAGFHMPTRKAVRAVDTLMAGPHNQEAEGHIQEGHRNREVVQHSRVGDTREGRQLGRRRRRRVLQRDQAEFL
jgi:hypothetical protein